MGEETMAVFLGIAAGLGLILALIGLLMLVTPITFAAGASLLGSGLAIGLMCGGLAAIVSELQRIRRAIEGVWLGTGPGGTPQARQPGVQALAATPPRPPVPPPVTRNNWMLGALIVAGVLGGIFALPHLVSDLPSEFEAIGKGARTLLQFAPGQ